jgi:2-dehydro-3-deoxyphosphogluconate aldolase / (4S)-4-hydroxy-2-oxoglutarate aldolase
MARFSRIQVVQRMKEDGMVPVFFHRNAETCKQVLGACYRGGARIFEFTNRGDRAHIVFEQLITWAEKEAPEMILGTGSVVDGPTAALYIQLGSNFIVSPILNEDMAKICNRRKIAWSPGCGSLSEISKAEELGAEVVKIFPASEVGGTSFIKAVLGPCPWTSIMPTGGVAPTEDNLRGWMEAGAFCVGMGSQLMVKNREGGFDFDGIELRTREALEIIRRVRKAGGE